MQKAIWPSNYSEIWDEIFRIVTGSKLAANQSLNGGGIYSKFPGTEPIFKILDAMESYGSESFISAILVPQNEFGIPPHARQLTGF